MIVVTVQVMNVLHSAITASQYELRPKKETAGHRAGARDLIPPDTLEGLSEKEVAAVKDDSM